MPRPEPRVVDAFSRPLRSLRVSVTDRCNLRCAYCMPEEQYTWLPDPHVLSFEELATVVDAFIGLGVRKVRLTGGEPLVRRELEVLVRLLAARPLEDLALTTNGVLLGKHARALKDAGLKRVTVSLDTLSAARFHQLTRRTSLGEVLAGIDEAVRVGLGEGLKLDTVALKGINDDELIPLLEYAGGVGAELRFIEYMDVGGATRWKPEQVLARAEILQRLARHYGPIQPLPEDGWAPAERFRLPDGRTFGIIASTTQPFCRTCDRARLTADGQLITCLYATRGVDLKAPLRGGAGPDGLAQLIASTWQARSDRGAEQRLALRERRGPLASANQLKGNPHLEMHTRGG